MDVSTYAAARQHLEGEIPKEGCGVVIIHKGKEMYWPCKNISKYKETDHFEIDPSDYADAEDAGEVVAIVHSHNGIELPSDADKVCCEKTGLRWYIIGFPSGVLYTLEPSGYEPPLVGRTYSFGVLDCITLAKDYYNKVLGIDFPIPHYSEDWWVQRQDLFPVHHAACGFVSVPTFKKHDILIMRVQSPILNHSAIYIGDGMILHHLQNRLSSREMYGTYYRKATGMIVRHKSLC